jgi:hypothetical protein
MSSTAITSREYNNLSIIVEGNTKPYKEEIKKIGGMWNKTLNGWIFPKKKSAEIDTLIKSINSGDVMPSENVERKYVTLEDFLSLTSRVERMEALVAQLEAVNAIQRVKIEGRESAEPQDESVKIKKFGRVKAT